MAKKKKSARKRAPRKKGVTKPRNWDKAVSAAFFRLLGASQELACERAGCARRAMVEWERSPWWPRALDEAQRRWLNGGDARARAALYKALEKYDAQTARWWAERRWREFKQERQPQQEHVPSEVYVLRIPGASDQQDDT